jgi:hypothetical protein
MLRNNIELPKALNEQYSAVDEFTTGTRQALPLRMVAAVPTAKSAWRARHESDNTRRVVGKGRYEKRDGGLKLVASAASPAVELAASAYSDLGLSLLSEYSTLAAVQLALDALAGVDVEFVENGANFADYDAQSGKIGHDVETATSLGLFRHNGKLAARELAYELPGGRATLAPDELVTGFGVICALAQLHEAHHKLGAEERQALHIVLDFYCYLNSTRPEVARAALRVLRTPYLDSGNVFALFLESSADAELAREIDDSNIGQLLPLSFSDLHAKAEAASKLGDTQTVQDVIWALKWRDRWVTWILGQNLVDMPYDQDRAFELLRERLGEDIDAKRRAVHQELYSTYDRRAEGDNIERLTAKVEQEGRMIVCGRISRAFGNQTQLLSAATTVDRKGLAALSAELSDKAKGIGAVATQVARITKLLVQTAPVSTAQLAGALWHLDEAIRDYQASETKKINHRKEADAEQLVSRRGYQSYQAEIAKLSERVNALFDVANRLRAAVETAPKKSAAFLILQQRFFPGETQLLCLANANRDTHPGKIEQLRDLTRKGGHNRYASEGSGTVIEADGSERSVSWISKCHHWIEAIPMFIKERIVKVPVVVGGQKTTVERIETEVDQRGMEAFFRFAAGYWVENCDEVVQSEHVAVAREFLIEHLYAADARSVAQRDKLTLEEAYLRVGREHGLEGAVGALTALVNKSYVALVERVGVEMETSESSRFEALRTLLLGTSAAPRPDNSIAEVESLAARERLTIPDSAIRLATEQGLQGEAARYAKVAWRKRRPISTLHILTTESAGMTEGYVQTWLETEMALVNVIKAKGWETEVSRKLGEYRTRITEIAEKVVIELGMEAVVQELMSENGVPRAAALGMLLATNRPVADEVSRVAVLIEEEERQANRGAEPQHTSDPSWVDAHIKANRERITALAIPKVVEANGRAIELAIDETMIARSLSREEAARAVSEADTDFKADLEFYIRSIARQEVIIDLDQRFPELNILRTQGEYLRNHTQLAHSFARRAVVAAHQAQDLTEHPLFNYRARGGKKKYNLLYTPSRVDLGAEEMDSIVRWAQWVGGVDRTAVNAGREFYGLINEAGVEVRPALAWQEIQKTSENASMTAGKAFANSVALLVNSVGEGDQQLMADQMFLRHDEDRGTPPASEGYGGYCVPKDGLFLAFVLELKHETKLRQMGIPPAMHRVVMEAAKDALLHYSDFSTDFEWQLWVAKKLLSKEKLKRYIAEYLGVRQLRDEEVLVFNITKISEAILHLGQPWHEVSDGDTLFSNLAAQWAVGKMIIGGEQVQRFMVFYKAWMISRALRQAGRADLGKVVLSAEYKPVQDIRYSAGNRIFEILAKTGEHLTYSLDEEGQNLVFLMMHGFTPIPELDAEQKSLATLAVGSEQRERQQKLVDRKRRVAQRIYECFGLDDQKDRKALLSLKEKFPPAASLADIRLVASTMSSTQDIFYYTDDTQLTQIADRVQQVLSDVGLTEEQMRANAEVYGGDLENWAVVKNLPAKKRSALLESNIVYRVGTETFEVELKGAIHALVLRLRGPGRSYNRDIQGADVLNTAIAFPEIFELIDNPPKLVALMLEGNPASALALTDGVSGRATRMLTYQDVMLYFATCDRLAGEGRGIYLGIGIGESVVNRLRHEMRTKRRRAEQLLNSVLKLCTASPAERPAALQGAQATYERLVHQIVEDDEAQEAIAEEERVKRYKRHRARDTYVTVALTRLAAGIDLSALDFGSWLAIGGAFVVSAMPEEELISLRSRFESGIALVPAAQSRTPLALADKSEVDAAVRALARPQFIPESQKFEQVLGRESSSKAVHAGETEARERRKALRTRQQRTEVFNLREKGFRDAFDNLAGKDLTTCHAEARRVLSTLLAHVEDVYKERQPAKRHRTRALINTAVGTFLACAYHGLVAAVEELYPTTESVHQQQKRTFLEHIAPLYTGREIVFEHWKRIAGGYQDMGDIARLAHALGNDRAKLEQLTLAIELFYTTLAFGQTVEHLQVERGEIQWTRFWDDITVFFAETINDHDCLYLPWNYVRGVESGVGFDAMSEPELYALAFARHSWLYGYFRTIFTHCTEIADLSAEEQDALLGNFTHNAAIAPIGGNGQSLEEQTWRAYNQLRETAFMLNDGFAVPEVFPSFDPDIIDAEKRVNIVFLFPVGRTHISRAFREGPTLNRDLLAEGRPGANLIVSRYDEFKDVDGAKRQVLLCNSGHLYVTRSELVEALSRHKGLSKSQAEARADSLAASNALTPKGVRLAVRFSRPIVAGLCVPYHGNALYVSGKLEDAGLPFTVQSLVHSEITYDKSLYPEVYQDSGVEMPPEIDWMMAYQQGVSREQALKQIAQGRPGFEGLRAFAEKYPIVLVKGAAESGARNLRVFQIGRGKNAWDEAELDAAALFIYERAGKQNMVIQEAARTTPEFWASPNYMTSFVNRQVTEWHATVNRDRHPRSQIYGSLRIIASSSHPERAYDLTHLITLASLQVATNVGRGGTLEPLLDMFVQERHLAAIREGLSAQVPLVMQALAKYAPRFADTFRAKRGREIGSDLRGVSYGWPAYLMLDYLVTPVFVRDGKLVDIEPRFDNSGERLPSAIILEDSGGRFEGEIASWRFIHLEPNVGIGLWDRFSLREEEWERYFADQQGRPFNWNNIGKDDRVVLRNFALMAEEYVRANFG